MQVQYIAINSIKIKDNRLRKQVGDIKGLAESIQQYGLLHPIIVTLDYELVTGYRRLMAIKTLGWSKIPALVMSKKMSSLELLYLEKEENLYRRNFTREELDNFQKQEWKMKYSWFQRFWIYLKKILHLDR